MSETEATGVTDDSAPPTATADVTEHTAIGVIDSAEEAIGGAEKWVDDFQRTVKESTDSAIRSARSLRENSTSQFRSIQYFIPHALTQYKTYENAFFSKVTEELINAKEHPAATVGIGVVAGLILMRGPRRFLFRHTLGRFQSEEAQFLKAEKHVKEMNMSVDLMKKESRKLLERAALAEKDMKHGLSELMNSGNDIHRLAKSVHKVECEATDLMDGLRQIPGREAIKLRAEGPGEDLAGKKDEIEAKEGALMNVAATVNDGTEIARVHSTKERDRLEKQDSCTKGQTERASLGLEKLTTFK